MNDAEHTQGGASGQAQPWGSTPAGRLARRGNSAIIAHAERLEAQGHRKAALYDGAQQSIAAAERTLKDGGWKK